MSILEGIAERLAVMDNLIYEKLIGDDKERNSYNADIIISYLKSQGLVQKVEGELPHLMPQVPNNEWSAGYCTGEEAMRDIMIERGYTLVYERVV
ncbi:hypothetical protein ES703_97679 [subsurface metagenome]